MFLRKYLFFSFLILYELNIQINAQEYLKELKPKDIQYISTEDLPPVELPTPINLERHGRYLEDEEPAQIKVTVLEQNKRLAKSEKPTLMDIVLEASVREGLNAMRRLYNEVEPDLIKKGQVLHDNHPAALLSKFSAPVVETTRREMAAYATLQAAKVFRQK
ncbi:hypothetical protein DOY81_010422 [Sarcophaga bullata]|nr:hypothetical protein DOY81_010422 [Sarcophaga bullata]